jgi:flagellar M-ring protein FliF
MSIQRLVAGAVDNLKPSDVTIIDADSNESLGSGADGAAGEEGMERQLSQRLVNTLAPVLGSDHLRASVNVEYDQGSSEESEDKYDPSVVVPLVSQKSKETNGGDGTSGVAGTSSNVPQTNPQANVPAPDGSDGGGTNTTDNTTYGVNKVTRHSIEPAGRIRRITAAVVVDDEVKRKLGPNGKWTETRQKRSLQELQQIQTLASSAIGIDTTRGDAITVQNLAFDRPDDTDVPPPTFIDKARKGMEDYSSLVRYGMLLALFALAYFLMIRPVQKKVLSTSVQLPPEPQLPSVAEALSLPTPSPEGARTLQLKERLIEQVKSEPATSARVVQAWLRGATE